MEILSIFTVIAVPLALVWLLPKKHTFYANPIIQGFGIGVYLGLIWVLVSESVELSSAPATVLWFSGGLTIAYLIGMLVREFHHHHLPHQHHSHNNGSVYRILVSDALHNAVDGVSIILGYSIGVHAGVLATIGVLLHQIVQQFGQQVLLVESQVPPRRAIGVSALIATTTLIPLVLAIPVSAQAVLMAVSAGVVSWKIFQDITSVKKTRVLFLGLILGAVLLYGSIALIPHTHTHEHTEEVQDHYRKHNHDEH